MIDRVAYLSYHTSPLSQPGSADAGGMNVYIHELAQTMADRGVEVDVFTRRVAPGEPDVKDGGGYRVFSVEAGPAKGFPIHRLSEWVEDFAAGVIEVAVERDYDLVHSHYWQSGWAGLRVKQALGIPLANSFHTLGRIKDQTRRSDEAPAALERIAAEHHVIEGSNCVIASTPYEAEDLFQHYGAHPARLCVSPPGINHDVFKPGDQAAARRSLGLAEGPVLLFVGRIQPLKGLDVAVEAFRLLSKQHPRAQLVVVGGPSGPQGRAELDAARFAAEDTNGRVTFVDPLVHMALAEYYQAADVLLFPSRSESFGLVAAEAQACGLPVVATAVGGIRYTVRDRHSGVLIDGWDPGDYAKAISALLDEPARMAQLSAGALQVARQFSWEATADRLLELYDGITG